MLSLHYNRSNSFLFFNAVKMYQLKAKFSEIKPYPLCLGKEISIDNMKNTGLNGAGQFVLLIVILLLLPIF